MAAEPLVCDVVDMAFDENYRLWVCELISYNESPTRSRGRALAIATASNPADEE